MERLKNWVASYPGFAGMPITLDALPGRPGCMGLFCRGEEILNRQADILGTWRCRKRLNLVLALYCAKDPEGDCYSPQLLLDFGRWVSASQAPLLGQDQQVRAQQGQLKQADAEGLGRYEIKIILEFTEVT